MVALWACASPEIVVKDRLVSTTVSTTVDSMNLCNGRPLGTAVFDLEKDLKEAGIDLNQGCLKAGSFELAAEVGAFTPGAGCAAVRGSITLTSFVVEANCTRGLERQSLRTTCAEPAIDLSDNNEGAVFLALERCLNDVERTQAEPLRKLINDCKPTTFRFAAEASCSPDLCFSGSLKVGFRTKNVVAQLGGTCP
jgi:hypothetical protein